MLNNCFCTSKGVNLFHRSDKAFCQITDMDVVSHSCTIRCRIIASTNSKLGKTFYRHPGNIGEQIVRSTVRILSDPAAWMGTDRIEIAQ